RKFEPEFYVQTYQEHAAWRPALRVGRRAEEIAAERNNNLRTLQPRPLNGPAAHWRQVPSVPRESDRFEMLQQLSLRHHRPFLAFCAWPRLRNETDPRCR